MFQTATGPRAETSCGGMAAIRAVITARVQIKQRELWPAPSSGPEERVLLVLAVACAGNHCDAEPTEVNV